MVMKSLIDGTSYVKAKCYDGRKLKGVWHVLKKIDGVRALKCKDGRVVSRNSKPLYNLHHLEFKDAEVFRENWNTSVSLCRTESYQEINQDDIYELSDGNIDKRLHLGFKSEPTPAFLDGWMQKCVTEGCEGIVIRQINKNGEYIWWKIVPEKRADIRITGFKEGTGKNVGMLGSFLTNWGSVGTGFDDAQRVEFWSKRHEMIGSIIQAKFRETTEAGKLRFPSFDRVRWDKDTEDVESILEE